MKHESVAEIRNAIRTHLRSLAVEMGDIQGKTIRAAKPDCDGLVLVFTDGTYTNISGGGCDDGVYDSDIQLHDAVNLNLNLVPRELLLALRCAEEKQRTGDKEYSGRQALSEALSKLGRDKVNELLKKVRK